MQFYFYQEHMIENEILILRRISHPNIVKLHEEFETPKEIYLVMELVEVNDVIKKMKSVDLIFTVYLHYNRRLINLQVIYAYS